MNAITGHSSVRVPQFIRFGIGGDLAFKLSEMLIDNVERSADISDAQSKLFIAHKLWNTWFLSRQTPNRPRQVLVFCDEWVLICIQVIIDKLKQEPSNEDLKNLYRCFTSGRVISEQQISRAPAG